MIRNENFFKSYTDQRLLVMLIALWVNSTEQNLDLMNEYVKYI